MAVVVVEVMVVVNNHKNIRQQVRKQTNTCIGLGYEEMDGVIIAVRCSLIAVADVGHFLLLYLLVFINLGSMGEKSNL